MKLSLYLSLIAVLSIATMQAASAQEEEGRPAAGARFNFAANVWKAESARLPKGYGAYNDPKHNVRAGSVPTSNMLGLDPIMVSKPNPVAPMVTPSTTAQVSFPKTTAAFNPAFGKPLTAQPLMAKPLLAHVPGVVPQHATATPMVPIKSASAAPAHAAPNRHVVHTAVAGVLKTPHITPASATPAIASYGNQGYTPGAYMPTTASQSSLSGTARLSGKILTHHR